MQFSISARVMSYLMIIRMWCHKHTDYAEAQTVIRIKYYENITERFLPVTAIHDEIPILIKTWIKLIE